MFNNTSFSSQRVAWIDNIKFFAIISVMIGHVSATYFHGEPYKDIVHHVLISWSMPLFVFISGYMGYQGFTRIHTLSSLDKYLVKMAERIMFPSLAYSSITYIFRMDLLHMIAGFLLLGFISFVVVDRELLSTRWHKVYLFVIYSLLVVNVGFGLFSDMWYFTFLLRYTILTACFYFLLNKYGNKIYYSTPFFILLVFLWKMPWFVNIELLSYFFLGIVSKKYVFFERYKRRGTLIPMASISMICAIVSCYFFFFHTFYDYNVVDLILTNNSELFFLRQFCGCCWCLAIASFMILLSRKYSFFSYWGSKTLPLYAIHATLMVIMSHLWIFRYSVGVLGGVSWIYVICATIFMFIVTAFICVIANKSRYGRRLLLGEKE